LWVAAGLRLKIGYCEIPEPNILFVSLSVGPFPVAFGGIVYGDKADTILRQLKLLAEEKAIPYEAMDHHGVESRGLCDIKDLKFEEITTSPVLVRFSGRLAHPFI
jgi:hypothetical protein